MKKAQRTEFTALVTGVSQADDPVGESNPCCRRERAVS